MRLIDLEAGQRGLGRGAAGCGGKVAGEAK